MSDFKRYEMYGDYSELCIDPVDNGDWCKYEDVKAEIESLRREVNVLRKHMPYIKILIADEELEASDEN
jgi:hypothetical protein